MKISSYNTRKCTNCNEVKPLHDFYLLKGSFNSLSSRCKNCVVVLREQHKTKNNLNIDAEIIDKYPSLKKADPPGKGATAYVLNDEWSFANLKDGFLYFKELAGKYPTAREVDSFEFLPSSRTIQRKFGGLVALRKKLGLKTKDYTKGKARSKIAGKTTKRAKDIEEEFFLYLTSRIPEVLVHEQKIIRPQVIRCDYFIYMGNEEGVVIDVFYANDLFNLQGIVNLKIKQYKEITRYPVLFILIGNERISQTDIETKMKNRKVPLPDNINVVTRGRFDEMLGNMLDQIDIIDIKNSIIIPD